MLKIRDDIDLKELEKFGFYKSGGVYQKNLEYDDINSPIVGIDICIYIIMSDRIIRFARVCAYEGKDSGMCLYIPKECFERVKE
jgi:hypothetical protein